MRLKTGVLAGAISGSEGATTFKENRAGAYAQLRTKPVKKHTSHTQAAKRRLAAMSRRWTALSDVNKQAWNQWAAQHPLIDRLGAAQTMTGQLAHNQINTRLDYMDSALLDAPPIATAPTALDTLTVFSNSAFPVPTRIIYTPTPIGADERIWMYACSPSALDKKRVDPLYKLLPVSPLAEASPYPFGQDFLDRLGAIQPGQVIRVKVFIINSDTGLLSIPIEAEIEAL